MLILYRDDEEQEHGLWDNCFVTTVRGLWSEDDLDAGVDWCKDNIGPRDEMWSAYQDEFRPPLSSPGMVFEFKRKQDRFLFRMAQCRL